MYGYTVVKNSEMSVSVSAFLGMLNIAHFKKYFYFRKISPQKQKSHHLYWHPNYESTYVCIEDEIKKKRFKYLYQYETFFFISKLFYWPADEVMKINQHKYVCMKAMTTSNTP